MRFFVPFKYFIERAPNALLELLVRNFSKHAISLHNDVVIHAPLLVIIKHELFPPGSALLGDNHS